MKRSIYFVVLLALLLGLALMLRDNPPRFWLERRA